MSSKRRTQKTSEPSPAAARGRLCELVMREALQEALQCDAALQAGQGEACALVDAQAEGEVFVGAAAEHQFAWTLENSWVAVGGADAQGHQCAGFVMLAAQREVLRGAAVTELIARFEAQQFIYGDVPVRMGKLCF